VGFAVPVDVVNRVVPELIRFGKVIRPGLGVTIASERIAERIGIEGVLVIDVQPGSTAEAAGIRGTYRSGGEIILGDIITAVGGRRVSTYDDLRNEFERYRVGDEVTLEVIRDGRRMSFRLNLEEVG
jgi:S1-C subfamily serine protease